MICVCVKSSVPQEGSGGTEVEEHDDGTTYDELQVGGVSCEGVCCVEVCPVKGCALWRCVM